MRWLPASGLYKRHAPHFHSPPCTPLASHPFVGTTFAAAATTVEARKFIAKVRRTATGALGGSSNNLIGDGEQDLEFVAGAAVVSTALLAARGASRKARGGGVAGEGRIAELEDRPLQRIGVSKEAAEATGAGQGEEG